MGEKEEFKSFRILSMARGWYLELSRAALGIENEIQLLVDLD